MISENQERIQETIEITNMTCKGCARSLENEMRKFENIDYAVSFPNKSITVVYSPKNHNLKDFEKAIESHGYKIKRQSY